MRTEQDSLDSLNYLLKLTRCDSEEERQAVRLEAENKKKIALKRIRELEKENAELEINSEVPVLPVKITLKADYPDFARDLPVLLHNSFLSETETGYKWLKSKNSLAFYFKAMTPTRKRDWAVIERAFSVSDLKNSSKTEYDKLPRDYEELTQIIPRLV